MDTYDKVFTLLGIMDLDGLLYRAGIDPFEVVACWIDHNPHISELFRDLYDEMVEEGLLGDDG